MNNVIKFTKILTVNKCTSFAQDSCFQKSRKYFKDIGLNWKFLIEENRTNRTTDGDLHIIPAMDSVFFHDDRFEILIDARGFKAEDVKCKLKSNSVELMAQKQEVANSTSRTVALARNYQLPRNVEPQKGNCCLSSEGILLITAPWQK